IDAFTNSSLLCEAGLLDGRGRSGRWIQQRQGEADAPIGAVTRCIGIIFAADLEADRLFPNLQNLADLKNDGDSPLAIGGGSVPVCGGFRINGESRMRLCRI